VDLHGLGYLDIATANPFRVTSTSEMLWGVPRQPALKEGVKELLEEERWWISKDERTL